MFYFSKWQRIRARLRSVLCDPFPAFCFWPQAADSTRFARGRAPAACSCFKRRLSYRTLITIFLFLPINKAAFYHRVVLNLGLILTFYYYIEKLPQFSRRTFVFIHYISTVGPWKYSTTLIRSVAVQKWNKMSRQRLRLKNSGGVQVHWRISPSVSAGDEALDILVAFSVSFSRGHEWTV